MLFPQKIISRLYAAVTLCKKSENFNALIFHKTWKTSFSAQLGSSFATKTSKQKFPP